MTTRDPLESPAFPASSQNRSVDIAAGAELWWASWETDALVREHLFCAQRMRELR